MRKFAVLFCSIFVLLSGLLTAGCSEKQEEEQKQQHRFSAWEIVKSAGYAADGEITRRCLDEGCSYSENKAVRASGGLSYITSEGTVYVSGRGSCADTLLYISSVTPDGRTVKGVAPSAFTDDATLSELVIDAGISYLGEAAFAGCDALKTAYLPPSAGEIETSVFSRCDALYSAILPPTMTAIPNDLFNECVSLSDLYLPDTIQRIGKSAFHRCLSFTTLDLPADLTELSSNAFSDCSSLKSVVFHDKLETIRSYAFSNCASLSSLVLPASLKTLEGLAFFKDTALVSVFLPKETEQVLAKDGLSPFYESNRALIIKTDADEKMPGWDDGFNIYFTPDSEIKAEETAYLSVQYGVQP